MTCPKSSRTAPDGVDRLDGVPAVDAGFRTRPRRVAPASVDRLTVVEVVGDRVRWSCQPALVGDDDLAVAVLERDLQLSDRAKAVAVERSFALEAEPSPVPTVAEGDAEHRGRAQQACDVVGAVPQSPLVARPSGAEHVVCDGVTVERRLEDSKARHVEGGRFDVTVADVEDDLPAQQRRAVEFDHRRDHARGPLRRRRWRVRHGSFLVRWWMR
jgi:hypothetical protein